MAIRHILIGSALCLILTACSSTTEEASQPDTPRAQRVEDAAATTRVEVDGQSVRARREAMVQATPASTPAVTDEAVAKAGRADQAANLIHLRHPTEPLDREAYRHFDTNPVHRVSESPVSTFSIDVDTASYANVRRFLNQGQLPRHDAVRVEELVNYFAYDYPAPESREIPFSLYTETGPSPWHPDRHLLHVGIRGYDVPEQALPPANLVFLIDVSGSMQSPDKLGLLKSALKLLSRRLDADDSVAIAVYAGAAGTVLPPTSGREQADILAAIDALTAGGSTNGGAGIRLAYALARQAFVPDGINRVILATDGDFNVGTTDTQALKELVEAERKTGVALTVLGFGTGNYNDALMQALAQIGDGNAAYIDTLNEARKVLIDEIAGTLNTIARDVKVQVEFNPDTVSEYRLIGYETRHLNREDFNNDAVDAGDIGAGHTVTALYEIALAGSTGTMTDPLRYGDDPGHIDRLPGRNAGELAFLKLRYKAPGTDISQYIDRPIRSNQIVGDLARTSDNYRFSAAVAAFGQILRGSRYTGSYTLDEAARLAAGARGNDSYGYRGEFLSLIRTAAALAASPGTDEPTG